MKLLSPGEQFANNYDFANHSLRFEGKVSGEPVYRNSDDSKLVVKRQEQWYDTGHTDITELRHAV